MSATTRPRVRRLDWHEVPCPPLPLKAVLGAGGRALPVWCALQSMAEARGTLRFKLRLRHLAAETGIQRRATLSRALTILNNAGWLLYSRAFRTDHDNLQSTITVQLLHNVRMPLPSRRFRRGLWLALFTRLKAEQPVEVRNALDRATHLWIWESAIHVAFPEPVMPLVEEVLGDLRPARGYGFVPVLEKEKPACAIKLGE